MADNTKIEWADATVNAVNGCSVLSPGCTNCYAMKQAHRFPARQGLTVPSKGGSAVAEGSARSRATRNMVWTGEVRLNQTQLHQPLKWKRPRRIFWNAHGDLFHENVPDHWIDRVFAVCALTPHHTHMILTKRSARLREYFADENTEERIDACLSEFVGKRSEESDAFALPLPNVWLGVSVEDQTRADLRIPDLLATPAAIRFISAEPLLGPVDLQRILPTRDPECEDVEHATNALTGEFYARLDFERSVIKVARPLRGIDWVIAGGESGPKARPMHPDWARSLRDQCQAAGTPFFFKQWGEWGPADTISFGGGSGKPRHDWIGSEIPSYRIGKKQAGRLLDGREWSEFPA
jgi:protein gp37